VRSSSLLGEGEVAVTSYHPGSKATAERWALRRAALWVLLASRLIALWGVRWDIQWHVVIGRDSFWIAPHLMTYAGVSGVVLVAFGILLWETGRPVGGTGTLRVLGLRGTRGFHVTAWGAAITVAAAPIDDLWHRLFGLDVTIWSPPHLLGFLGGAVSSLGSFLIAREVYPPVSRARLVALVLAGAWLYTGLQPVIEPGYLVAYRHGGIGFHTFAMLASLLLPLPLVTTARLTGLRWAPALVAAVMLVATLAGLGVARAGFAWLQPVPAVEEAIAADPTSPIALAHEIAAKNRTGPGVTAAGVARLLAVLPPLVMAAVDARRRPVAATVGYGVSLFVLVGWQLAASPAFRPVVPGPLETTAALGLTIAAAVIGGLAARRLSDALAAAEDATVAGTTPRVT
jgi:hypothetical protein